MKTYNEQNQEIEITCACGSKNFTFESIGFTQGLTCGGCKVFRTVENWQKLQSVLAGKTKPEGLLFTDES